ncbi:hypothetical protein Tco_1156974 [Tanacetum coccineum]
MHPTSKAFALSSVRIAKRWCQFDQELQKQRTSHGKQPAISVCNLSCMWRERALQKLRGIMDREVKQHKDEDASPMSSKMNSEL